ncbi:MAG: response regulator transcription factor [Planctomyces sp.]|nr:response regulator transcription factor [Planctomyces sp.]
MIAPVTLLFPLLSSDAPTEPRDQDAAPNVLLIEDEAPHARIVQRAFEQSADPYRLTVVESMAAARKQIQNSPPDLVIADLVLPDGRGTDLLDEPGLKYPLVVMTSHGDERIAVEALRSGALDYVVKSAESLMSLPRVARRTLREWDHIRARARAERELQEREWRHRALLDAIPDLIFVISVDGRFLDCRGGRGDFQSEQAVRLVGRDLQDVVSPDDRTALLKSFSEVLATNLPESQLFELLINEQPLHVEARIAPYDSNSVLAILRDVTERQRVADKIKELTAREWEVLRLVAGGKSNKQMASALDLSIKTIEAHRARLMKKLGARNMAELMRLAIAVRE